MQQDAEFSVRVSFLELYNEDIFDLLSATDDLTKLRLYEDSARKGSVIIQVSWDRDEDLFVVAIQLVVVLVVNLSFSGLGGGTSPREEGGVQHFGERL